MNEYGEDAHNQRKREDADNQTVPTSGGSFQRQDRTFTEMLYVAFTVTRLSFFWDSCATPHGQGILGLEMGGAQLRHPHF